MQLAFREMGQAANPPLIMLHGLLGSSRNWLAAGRELAADFAVKALDLRNHGASPHAPEMDFPALAGDVLEFIECHQLENVTVMGHSLGGKVAMRLAADQPSRCRRLIVVDIAPRDYGLHYQGDLEAMAALDLQSLKTRREADEALQRAVPDWGQRQFLLTNLKRDGNGSYAWQINLDALLNALPEMRRTPLARGEAYSGPSLFLAGAASDFIRPQDHVTIKEHFPQAQIDIIPDSGHNPHMDNRAGLLQAIRRFAQAE